MQHRCNIRRIFGKTFHKNMSAADIKAAWDQIPDEVKNEFKDVKRFIDAAAQAEEIAAKAVPIYHKVKKALNAQEKAVAGSAASAAGNAAYAVALAAKEAAEAELRNFVQGYVEEVKEVYNVIKERMEQIGACIEKDPKEQQKQEVL